MLYTNYANKRRLTLPCLLPLFRFIRGDLVELFQLRSVSLEFSLEVGGLGVALSVLSNESLDGFCVILIILGLRGLLVLVALGGSLCHLLHASKTMRTEVQRIRSAA